jgi:hypothetical protein
MVLHKSIETTLEGHGIETSRVVVPSREDEDYTLELIAIYSLLISPKNIELALKSPAYKLYEYYRECSWHDKTMADIPVFIRRDSIV